MNGEWIPHLGREIYFKDSHSFTLLTKREKEREKDEDGWKDDPCSLIGLPPEKEKCMLIFLIEKMKEDRERN